ncbi:glycosyltransferase family 2 protein [Mobilicoccus pelagius]|uniref:Putative glycosyltransferase n=1 Tax=Mobilicoccus pelagius NBRC 104925 TaxID=1089455 RepID=H5UVE4_9MICO|nr:glycosyltransferase family A protein [Mobilicoccus pelagius]GAB49702.1 putative glycosyltransferase [Mobilicoccus pelagius NBRC 104925]
MTPLPTTPLTPAEPTTPPSTAPSDPSATRPVPGSLAVVVPCFDYEDFVGDAIESVLRQSRPYAQVIVVDDGSRDRSLDVIRRYADRIEIIEKANSGLLGACLAGLERVRTEYVHFLDADDTALPDLVETVTPALASRPVKVQFALAAIDEDGAPNGSVFPSFAPGYDVAAMREDNRVVGFYQCPPTSGNVFHVATLRSLGLDREDPRLPLDGAGCAVMPYLGEIVSIPTPLGGYRVHGASMSNTQLTPTPEQTRKEIRDFERNWEVAARVMGQDAPPYAPGEPLFLLERRLIHRGLTRTAPDPIGLARYLARLSAANLPRWQRVVQGVWMSSLLVPSREARASLVLLRRSGAARPRWVRRLLALVRR